jgi:hypothetical protein
VEQQNLAGIGEQLGLQVGMKTDQIRTDIIDITFVFIFLSGFGFEYG